MINILGIDHPLVCVRDLEAAQAQYAALGFTVTGIARHPWGTSAVAMLFENALFELMSVHNEALLDGYAAGDFRFGRFIHEALQEREGIALTALYTDDADRDTAAVIARGGVCQGTIEFGRDVTLPDGTRDRTRTTLKIFRSDRFPRLSNFACQQHKRHLVEPAEPVRHPNTAFGFDHVAILAEPSQTEAVLAWLAAMHGPENIVPDAGATVVQTGNGRFVVMTRAQANAIYGPLPAALTAPAEPYPFAIGIKVRSLAAVRPFLAGQDAEERDRRIVLADSDRLGGIILSIVEVPAG